MHFFLLYALSITVTFYLGWLLRPEYIEGFISNFPNLYWNDLGLILVLFNYTILALGLFSAFNKNSRSNSAIISGGLIAASSTGSLLSLSFVFNFMWAAVTPKYLLIIIIGIYVVTLGGPLLIYSIKENENDQPTSKFLNAELESQLKTLLVEIEYFAIKNKLSTSTIEKLENILNKKFRPNTDWSEINGQLQNILSSIELPENLIDKVISLQQKIKES